MSENGKRKAWTGKVLFAKPFFSGENLDILYITKIFVSRICTNCQILTQKWAKKKKPSKITALYHFWN